MKKFEAILLTLILAGCSNQPASFTHEYEGKDSAALIFSAPTLKYVKTVLGTFPEEVNAALYDECDKSVLGKSSGQIGKFILSADPTIGKTRTVRVKGNEMIFVEFGINNQSTKGYERYGFIPKPNGKYIFLFQHAAWKYHVTSGELISNDKGEETLKEIDFSYRSKFSDWKLGSWKRCQE